MSVNDIVVPEDYSVSLSYIISALDNKENSKSEFIKRYFHKSGKIVTCQISSSLVYDDNGLPSFFISHIKDITLRVEQEQELKELNAKLSETVSQLKTANVTKDKFFRIIAHDLKNPFHSILGLSELLINNLPHSDLDDIKQMALLINKSTNDAYKLLENLLSWSMAQTNSIPFQPQKNSVQNLLTEAIDLTYSSFAKAKNISIVLDVDENATIYADTNMLGAILRNLIGNAVKFTDKQGKIQISVVQNSHETQFSVRDTGWGISENIIDKLFKIEEKISTPSIDAQTGTGLGLLLCKEFVERHNGKIWVESELGKGSDFKFTISHQIQ